MDANRDGPFFMNLWTLLPQGPLNPTEMQSSTYASIREVATQNHYASVTAMDSAIGQLLDYIYGTQMAARTVIVFSSTSGPTHLGSAGPFRGRRPSLYEGGVRVPFVVQWRGHVPRNRVDNVSVLSALDLLPTVCGLAGVPLPEDLIGDGEDVSGALLSGDIHQRSKPLMWQWRFFIRDHVLHRSPMLAVRDGPWKLLLNPDGSRVELYNIPLDPSELNNLAQIEPQHANRLSGLLLAWHQMLPRVPVDPRAGQRDYIYGP